MGFREQLAVGMERLFLGRRFAPEQIAVLAGAGSVLELLFYALADPGDGVLVPTPSYAGFWGDLETRDELTIVPVPTSDADGFRLSAERLDRAVAGAGRPVRALLFTTPNNPVGTVYTPAEIAAVLDWADGAGVHVVLDEIYALSVHGARPFTSGARVVPRLGPTRHIVWAFSKDFAASGLRCGVLVSENEAVLAAVDSLAYWAATSGDTQHLLGGLLADEAWLAAYVASNQARLAAAYRATTGALTAAGIPFVPAEAGFFCLVDMRRFLDAPTWAHEDALWRRMLARANVNLTPGSACRAPEPGFFRLCFAAVPPEQVVEAVARIGATLA
jgi:aspartate/methionine/tyrosine aminotransferase